MTSSTQSSTTNTTTTTTTTTTSPPPTTPSEPSTTTPTILAQTPSKPFRLLDLPFELVSQILEHSIEGVSSETEPIEIAFSSSSSSCITTTTTPIIEEEEITREEKDEEEKESEKETRSIPLSININLIEIKYPHEDNKSHPGIFQTCRILRSEGPSPFPPPKNPPKINIPLFSISSSPHPPLKILLHIPLRRARNSRNPTR